MLLALAGCATEASSKHELDELKAEVHSAREENARLSRRLERLELDGTMRSVRGAPTAASEVKREAVPELTVVKLKPKTEPAPALATQVSVVEPEPDRVEELIEAARSEKSDTEQLDPSIGDAMFEQGLAALKTGNLEGGVQRLQQLVAEMPRHPKADNALYFSGVGLFGQGDFAGAAGTLERLIAEYPAGDAVVEGLLKLGDCRLRLHQPRDAKAAFDKVVKGYPGTAAAAIAVQRLTALNKSKGSTNTGSP